MASHHDLIIGRRAYDQVRQLNASLLQALADQRIGFVENFLENGGDVLHGTLLSHQWKGTLAIE